MYARALDLDEVLPDPAQQQVIELLQARYVQLMQNPPQRPGTFRRLLAGFNMGSAQAQQPLKDSICGAEWAAAKR